MTAAILTRDPKKQLRQQEFQGPRKRITGGWIADLAALGKCIWLCAKCTPKFNPAAYRYRRSPTLPSVRGRCDGCRDNGLNTMFVHENHTDGWNGHV